MYDADRNALTFEGGSAGIYHPPCRLWGKLRAFSNAPETELFLAIWATIRVRRDGGIIEHPSGSKLWETMSMPRPGEGTDKWGGYSIKINQYAFGHKALKPTWLYINGLSREELPTIPTDPTEPPEYVIGQLRGVRKGQVGWKKECTDREREHTPIELAKWLIEVAQRINKKNNSIQGELKL